MEKIRKAARMSKLGYVFIAIIGVVAAGAAIASMGDSDVTASSDSVQAVPTPTDFDVSKLDLVGSAGSAGGGGGAGGAAGGGGGGTSGGTDANVAAYN